MAWMYEFEPTSMRERSARAGNSVKGAEDALLAVDSR
jgi:hypothetical protein